MGRLRWLGKDYALAEINFAIVSAQEQQNGHKFARVVKRAGMGCGSRNSIFEPRDDRNKPINLLTVNTLDFLRGRWDY